MTAQYRTQKIFDRSGTFDGMKLRLAVAPDLDAVIACENLAFNMSPSLLRTMDVSPRSELALQISRGEIHILTAGARFLGYISASRKYDHMFVAAIGVLPQYHRMGIGSRLLDHVEWTAGQRGIRKVRLFTDGNNAGNLGFYGHHGYQEASRCEDGDFCRVFLSKLVGGVDKHLTQTMRRRISANRH